MDPKPKPMSIKRLLRILTPLLAFVSGLVIKFCFIDNPGDKPGAFIFETYIKHLWLEIYMIALGFSFIEEKSQEAKPIIKSMTPFFVLTAIACVIIVWGLPKFKITDDLLIIWTPLLVCSVLFATVSSKLSK